MWCQFLTWIIVAQVTRTIREYGAQSLANHGVGIGDDDGDHGGPTWLRGTMARRFRLDRWLGS